MIHLSEDILHFVWKNALFDLRDLTTSDGQPLQFISRGKLNQNSGPDFSHAKIKIGDTIWAGNIEIHVHSSDWNLHHHQTDPAYDNVILHVVYFHDKEIKVKNQFLPVFELKNRIPPSLFRKYKVLLKKENDLPCGNLIKEIKSSTILKQIEISEFQRLERKSHEVLQLLKRNHNDWEETTFQLLLYSMVGKVNLQPAIWVSEKVSLKLLRQENTSQIRVEAFLLGVCGWLKNLNNPDEYSSLLLTEFTYQKSKYALDELNPAIWKTGRMRPAQFPAFRLAQLANLIFKNCYLFTIIIDSNIEVIKEIFSHVEASSYWRKHCQLNKVMIDRSAKLGKMYQEVLLINVIVPILYAFGLYTQNESLKTKAVELLKNITGEKNIITKRWKSLGVVPYTSFESQGLIEVYNTLCIRKKCLSCNIGMHILKV